MPVRSLHRDRVLAAVSTAQLATGVAGLTIALKRRHPYHFIVLRGHSDAIRRDAIWMGTALSPPVPMLALQSLAIARVARGSRGCERRVLGGLGTMMVVGYLGESLVRARLFRVSRWDGVESPVALAGLVLAATMAVAGLRGSSARPA